MAEGEERMIVALPPRTCRLCRAGLPATKPGQQGECGGTNQQHLSTKDCMHISGLPASTRFRSGPTPSVPCASGTIFETVFRKQAKPPTRSSELTLSCLVEACYLFIFVPARDNTSQDESRCPLREFLYLLSVRTSPDDPGPGRRSLMRVLYANAEKR